MSSFTDRKGRVWDLSLDVAIARRIDKSDFKQFHAAEFSFLNMNPELFGKLISNTSFMCAVIWAIVQEQALGKWDKFWQAQVKWKNTAKHCDIQGAAFTPDEPFKPPVDSFATSPKDDPEGAELEFVSGFNGPTIEAARKVMVEELSNFFPEARTVLSKLQERLSNLQSRLGTKMEKAQMTLEQMEDEAIDKAIDELKQRLGKSYSLSQPSPESPLVNSGPPA